MKKRKSIKSNKQNENIRRKFNYIPFIFELLKSMAAKGTLPEMIDKALKKEAEDKEKRKKKKEEDKKKELEKKEEKESKQSKEVKEKKEIPESKNFKVEKETKGNSENNNEHKS